MHDIMDEEVLVKLTDAELWDWYRVQRLDLKRTNWRTARSTTTVSFCDGTLAAAFVTVSHGTPP